MVTWGPLTWLISGFVRRTPFFFWTSRSPAAPGEPSVDRRSVPTIGAGLAYRRHSRPILMQAIANHAAKADLHIFPNPKALRRFVADLGRETRSEGSNSGIEEPKVKS
jgi:hypothetical protein